LGKFQVSRRRKEVRVGPSLPPELRAPDRETQAIC